MYQCDFTESTLAAFELAQTTKPSKLAEFLVKHTLIFIFRKQSGISLSLSQLLCTFTAKENAIRWEKSLPEVVSPLGHTVADGRTNPNQRQRELAVTQTGILTLLLVNTFVLSEKYTF